MDPALTEEEERFMRWLEEDDVSGHHAEGADVPLEWHALRHNVDHLRDLLRATLPASKEPPATEAFNDEVRQQLD